MNIQLSPSVAVSRVAAIGALVMVAAWVAACEGDGPRGALRESVSFGANPGNLAMYEYIPVNLALDAPLVVVMHGCSQTASEYFYNAGWDKLADENGFAVVLPEQKTGNNSGRCFNWFESGDNRRGQGEAQSIASMIDTMLADHGLDAGQVYATGLSAGGAMTSVMLATYPEKFAGGAIMAGVVYGCADGLLDSFSCMSSPSGTPYQWGDAVRAASSHTGPWPLVSIWHGTSDYTVNHANLTESLEQWTDVHGIDRVPDATASEGAATHDEYRDGSGVTRVETWSLSGMGHATAIDPGGGFDQCGQAGAFMSDEDICSGYRAIARWGITRDSGDQPDAGPGDDPDAAKPDAAPDSGPDSGPDAGPDAAPDADTGGHVCSETFTNNYMHVVEGRAYHSLGNAYAIGSDDLMGLFNTFYQTNLAETVPGYYVVGPCP